MTLLYDVAHLDERRVDVQVQCARAHVFDHDVVRTTAVRVIAAAAREARVARLGDLEKKNDKERQTLRSSDSREKSKQKRDRSETTDRSLKLTE